MIRQGVQVMSLAGVIDVAGPKLESFSRPVPWSEGSLLVFWFAVDCLSRWLCWLCF